MKKGCFFSTIIFLTIAIGIGFYLFKKYSPEIKNYGREKIIQLGMKNIIEKIDKLNKTVYQDSLKIYLNNQMVTLRKGNYNKMRNFDDILRQVKLFIEDGKIDSVEYRTLKKMAIRNE